MHYSIYKISPKYIQIKIVNTLTVMLFIQFISNRAGTIKLISVHYQYKNKPIPIDTYHSVPIPIMATAAKTFLI